MSVWHRLGVLAVAWPVWASGGDLFDDGVQALLHQDLQAAHDHWRRFVNQAPVTDGRLPQVRGHLTLLARELARVHARQAVRQENQAPGNPRHLAILPFDNMVLTADLRPGKAFNKALMAFLATDLSQVPQLKVLERDKIRELLAEQQLSQTGLVDPAGAVRTGRLLQAGTVITGSVWDEEGAAGYLAGRYRINTTVLRVAGQQVLGVQEADGPREAFFQLEKEIAYEILATLGITDIPAAVGRIHTRNWDAYAAFADGLRHLDEGHFDQARQAFELALHHDPQFELAREHLAGTPSREIPLEELAHVYEP